MNKSIITLLLCLAAMIVFSQEKKEVKPDSTKKERPKKKKDLPLEVGRRIPVKTNEGTWMSLDVSP
ncbi:MAG: hypothetical protein ACKOC0_13480, partial [Cytophagales bacterium]